MLLLKDLNHCITVYPSTTSQSMVSKPPVPAYESQRPGRDDLDISETSTLPLLPLTAANISVQQQVLEETPQHPVAHTEYRTGPAVRLEESVRASAIYDAQGNVSYDGPTNLETIRNDRLTPFGNLTLNIQVDERPPLARSTSLEVHVPLPNPIEERLESPNDLVDINLGSPQEVRPALSTKESSLTAATAQNSARRYSFAETTTSESGSFIILTPQLSSGTPSRSSSVPAPPFSPWQAVRNPAGFVPSPHLRTIEETLDDQLNRPNPRLDHSPLYQDGAPQYGGVVSNYSRPLSVVPGAHNGERPLLPPRIENAKYPPCWTTEEGLLIVPSVPGELVKEFTPRDVSENPDLVETVSSNEKKIAISADKSDTADDLVEVAALSPNVTTYRKGNFPRRKRSPSYYDPDILPHQRNNHVK